MLRSVSSSSFVAGLILVYQISLAAIAFASEPGIAKSNVRIGWNRPTMGQSTLEAHSYLLGRWTQAVVDFDAPAAGEYQVQVTAPDPDGHRVTFSAPARDLPQGPTQISGFFKTGRLNAEIDVQVVSTATGQIVVNWNSLNQPNLQLTSITPQSRLIVTTGNPSGFDWNREVTSSESGTRTSPSAAAKEMKNFQTIATTVDRLPEDPVAYDGVTLVVIAGPSVVSARQSIALREWVAGGGRLMISLPANLTATRQVIEPLKSWLPATVGEDEMTVRNFGKLEYYAGRNVRIPFAGRLSVPSVKINQGEYLAGGRDEALLVRSPYGLGSVTVLALDLTVPPLTEWSEVSSLGQRLAQPSGETDVVTRRTSKSMQLSSSGVTDFATQLHAIQEDFTDVTRASPWFVMGSLGVLLLLIGPLDYLIVLRVLKRPRSTWVTLPLWIALGTILSSSLAVRWNGSSTRINQLNLVNVDVASSTCHQKLWTNVYSPVTGRTSLSIRSSIPSSLNADEAVYSSWSGVAESSFGGMLRPPGLDIAQTDYRQAVDGRLERLPLIQWSSKPFLTEIHSHSDRLVECDLQANSGGRLSGSLIHRFGGPIEDWILVHGNRVYRQMKQREDTRTLPLAAQQYWRVDQPNVYQRELRAFLTGEITTSKRRDVGATGSDVVHRNAEYDPLSYDAGTVLRILTFYQDAGGHGYTGLANNLLESEDLSHLLKLGRAVLFGRLKQSAAVIQVDGNDVSPTRESTFVRLVLPVRKATSDMPPELEPLAK